MKWIKEYWFIISGVILPVITFLVGSYKTKLKETKLKEEQEKKDLELVREAMKAMQRNSLFKSCEDYINRGFCSMHAKETIDEQYNSYHLLGGDSFITDMVRQVKRLPNNLER